MSSSARAWDRPDFLRLVAARYEAGQIVVDFGDGARERVDVERMTNVQARRPDWRSLRVQDYELVVPTADGPVEISSFAIRSLADREFRAHVAEREKASATIVGHRVRALRRDIGLTVEELADRAGVAPSIVANIERGKHDGNLTELQRVVSGLGRQLDDLSRTDIDAPVGTVAQTA